MSMTAEAYREQIRRTATALAIARNEELDSDLAPGVTTAHVKMFTDGNLDKRFSKLQDGCELLADGFDDLDDLIEAYVRSVPLSAYDVASTDAERFLTWLEERASLTDEQRDLVVCQRGRHAVEFVALKQRLAHVRFQELLSVTPELLGSASPRSRLTVHLNPIHAWAAFQTRILLEEDDEIPATVLFYPVSRDIRTAVIDAETECVLRRLEAGPLALRTVLRELPHLDRGEAFQLLRELCELGIVALG